MGKTKRADPKVPAELEASRFEDALDDHYITNCRILQETIEFEASRALHIDTVVFENVNFIDIAWPRSEFVDVIFINCDLSNADFTRCVFHRTEFRNSKLVGTNFAEAGVRHSLFVECVLNYATFGFSLCTFTEFRNCSMRQADFYEVELKETVFTLCDMEDINFAETNLRGVDLSTNRFESIQVTVEKLAGCTVSPNQALAFVRQMGMRISDEE